MFTIEKQYACEKCGILSDSTQWKVKHMLYRNKPVEYLHMISVCPRCKEQQIMTLPYAKA